MSTISTHILDTVTGEPASEIVVRLERAGGGELGRARTNADGRISDFGVASLPAGTYRLVFETGPYLSGTHPGGTSAAAPNTGSTPSQPGDESGAAPFFPEVVVTFNADGRRPRYHVPLLLSPHAYSTYRGS